MKIVELVAANIIQLLPTSSLVVREFFDDRTFKPDPYVSAEDQLLDSLRHYIPPGEVVNADGTAEAFPPEWIITSAWLFWSEGLPGWTDAPPTKYQCRLMLGRLMLKALEVSFVRRRFAEIA